LGGGQSGEGHSQNGNKTCVLGFHTELEGKSCSGSRATAVFLLQTIKATTTA